MLTSQVPNRSTILCLDGGSLGPSVSELRIAGQTPVDPVPEALFDSHNMGYVMRANSSVLVLRLVWQSSLATLPYQEPRSEPFRAARLGQCSILAVR